VHTLKRTSAEFCTQHRKDLIGPDETEPRTTGTRRIDIARYCLLNSTMVDKFAKSLKKIVLRYDGGAWLCSKALKGHIRHYGGPQVASHKQ